MLDQALSARTVLLRCLAIGGVVVAVIHFAVAGEHFEEYWLFGVFMLVSAWLQLGWAVLLLTRPSKPILLAGAIVNAGVVVVYTLTRTVGDMLGPTPHDVEPVGFGDLFCTIVEALLVLGALQALTRPMAGGLSHSQGLATVGGVGVLAVLLLSYSLVHGGSEMVMSMDSGAPPLHAVDLHALR